MPLSGKAMLITMMNVDAADEEGFNDWYDKEHLAERVGIDGFTEARRYQAVDAQPKYLNFYTTETFEVLDSPQYRKALANQTERSLYYIERFRDGGRAIVRVSASHGQGRGSTLYFAAIRPLGQDADALRTHLDEALRALILEQEIISAHLVESDPQLSKPLTEAVPPPSASDWYVMVEGTSSDAVRRHGRALVGNTAHIPADAVVAEGIYAHMWDLSRAEL